MVDSRIPGFFKKKIPERRKEVAERLGHTDLDWNALDAGALPLEIADRLVENVIGTIALPAAMGLNLRVNERDYLVPMVIEEPSVVAALSNAARMARLGGGFFCEADPPIMFAQVQFTLKDPTALEKALQTLREHQSEIDERANKLTNAMQKRGGGYKRTELRALHDPTGESPMLVVHLYVHVVDAMGANVVNELAEQIAPFLEKLISVRANLRILSNLATERLARARTQIPVEAVGGENIAHRIADADRFARLDPYRAATHNKGIMNGIDAVLLATGNDWRSVEAAAHAYAARSGQYAGLTTWSCRGDILLGELELPMAVGIVGGTTRSHPGIQLLTGLLGVKSATELACILVAVGLAQNLAALRALVSEGIQHGHMALHARQIAISEGADPQTVDILINSLPKETRVTPELIREKLKEIRDER